MSQMGHQRTCGVDLKRTPLLGCAHKRSFPDFGEGGHHRKMPFCWKDQAGRVWLRTQSASIVEDVPMGSARSTRLDEAGRERHDDVCWGGRAGPA
jgi:hypothetical protein